MAVGAGIGQGIQSFMGGYHEGKMQALQERAYDAARKYDQGSRYLQLASQYSDTDPNAYKLFMGAYGQMMEEGDKLSGEKGQGAWKSVKPLLHALTGGQLFNDDKDQQQPKGTIQPISPPDQATMERTDAPGQQYQQDYKNYQQQYADYAQQAQAAGMQPPSPWAQMAQNPPPSHMEMRQRAVAGVGKFLDQFPDEQTAKNTPGFYNALLSATMAGSQFGINVPALAANRWAPTRPQITIDKNSSFYPILSQNSPNAPESYKVDIETAAALPALAKGQYEAALNATAQGILENTVAPGSPRAIGFVRDMMIQHPSGSPELQIMRATEMGDTDLAGRLNTQLQALRKMEADETVKANPELAAMRDYQENGPTGKVWTAWTTAEQMKRNAHTKEERDLIDARRDASIAEIRERDRLSSKNKLYTPQDITFTYNGKATTGYRRLNPESNTFDYLDTAGNVLDKNLVNNPAVKGTGRGKAPTVTKTNSKGQTVLDPAALHQALNEGTIDVNNDNEMSYYRELAGRTTTQTIDKSGKISEEVDPATKSWVESAITAARSGKALPPPPGRSLGARTTVPDLPYVNLPRLGPPAAPPKPSYIGQVAPDDVVDAYLAAAGKDQQKAAQQMKADGWK